MFRIYTIKRIAHQLTPPYLMDLIVYLYRKIQFAILSILDLMNRKISFNVRYFLCAMLMMTFVCGIFYVLIELDKWFTLIHWGICMLILIIDFIVLVFNL